MYTRTRQIVKLTQGVPVLPAWFVFFSVAIRLGGGGRYAWGILTNDVKPHLITWLLWGVTSLIAFGAQVHEKVGLSAIATLALGLSPLFVCFVALIKKKYVMNLNVSTGVCAVAAVTGIVLWRVTDDADAAIWFSIFADIFASLPTLIKAYHHPVSEDRWAYLVSMVSLVVVLLTIKTWDFAGYAFPVYMFLINTTLFAFANLPIRGHVHSLRDRDDIVLARELVRAEDF